METYCMGQCFLLIILSNVHVHSLWLNGDEEFPGAWRKLEGKINLIESIEKKILATLYHKEESGKVIAGKAESSNRFSSAMKNSYDKRDSFSAQSEGLIEKLESSSKRMESMVVMLADLKGVLSQAVSVQESQMALTSEVLELREETKYLREEVQNLKNEWMMESSGRNGESLSATLQNRILNDEKTLKWMKESVNELRQEMVEVFSSINITNLLHIRQNLDKDEERVKKDFQTIQKQIEKLAGGQIQTSESLIEVKASIGDLQSWQTNFGQKSFPSQSSEIDFFGRGIIAKDLEQDDKSSWSKVLWKNHSVKDDHAQYNEHYGYKARHGLGKRKLWKEMKTMGKIIQDIVHKQTFLHNTLAKLEIRENSKISKSPRIVKTRAEEVLFRPIQRSEKHANVEPPSLKLNVRNSDKSDENYETLLRLSELENSASDYANKLEKLETRVGGLTELKNSNTQLFASLEGLETNYDGRLGEIHSTMAKLEASISTTNVVAEECREQQKYHLGLIESLRRDANRLGDRSKNNLLRISAIQSEMTSWGIKTCLDDNAESMQNIKIANIESELRAGGCKIE